LAPVPFEDDEQWLNTTNSVWHGSSSITTRGSIYGVSVNYADAYIEASFIPNFYWYDLLAIESASTNAVIEPFARRTSTDTLPQSGMDRPETDLNDEVYLVGDWLLADADELDATCPDQWVGAEGSDVWIPPLADCASEFYASQAASRSATEGRVAQRYEPRLIVRPQWVYKTEDAL
jgi:hypothetical protein